MAAKSDLIHNDSFFNGNTSINGTIVTFSKEDERAAIYVIVVIVTYACSIFALLTLVLCKKKHSVLHTDRDVNRFLRNIEEVRVSLRRGEQKCEVRRFMREISATPNLELVRSLSMDAYFEEDTFIPTDGRKRTLREKPPLRRAMSEGARAIPLTTDISISRHFKEGVPDLDVPLTKGIHSVLPPTYEETKHIFDDYKDSSVASSTHCQSCTCHLHTGTGHQIYPAPTIVPKVLVHRPFAPEGFYVRADGHAQVPFGSQCSSIPRPQYFRRPMLHPSSGRTRIPQPVVRDKQRKLSHIKEDEEVNVSVGLLSQTNEQRTPEQSFVGGKEAKESSRPNGKDDAEVDKLEVHNSESADEDPNRNRRNVANLASDEELSITSPLLS